MISPLNNVQLESGIRDYLVARLEAAEITVPAPTGEEDTGEVVPLVIAASGGTPAPTTRTFGAVLVAETPADLPGLYGERLRVQVIASTPYPYPPGITAADHAAFSAALEACFPARPRHGSATYEDDLDEWEALNIDFSDAVEEATGYLVNGWHIEGSRTTRTPSAIETVLTFRPCVYHPDHVG